MISGSQTGGGAGGLRGPQWTKLRRRLPRANDRQLRAKVRGFNTQRFWLFGVKRVPLSARRSLPVFPD
jgi:hypothetical protein